MTFKQRVNLWDDILSLITLKTTGTQQELSQSLGLNPRRLTVEVNRLNDIANMKMINSLGKPIMYHQDEKKLIFVETNNR